MQTIINEYEAICSGCVTPEVAIWGEYAPDPRLALQFSLHLMISTFFHLQGILRFYLRVKLLFFCDFQVVPDIGHSEWRHFKVPCPSSRFSHLQVAAWKPWNSSLQDVKTRGASLSPGRDFSLSLFGFQEFSECSCLLYYMVGIFPDVTWYLVIRIPNTDEYIAHFLHWWAVVFLP